MKDLNAKGTRQSLKINALLNSIRQTSALIFPLLTFPYVSRVLGSAEYGRYSFAVSVVNYFLLFASFGISNYAVREGARIRNDAQKISELASDLLAFSFWTSIVAYVFLAILTSASAKLRGYQALIYIQSFCIALTAIGMDWINTIYEDFLYITVRYILLHIVACVLVFVCVKSPADTGKYCLILMLASYGGNLLNLVYIRRYVKLKFRFRVKLRKYLLPLSILFVNSLATTIYVNSDITMLGFYKTDEIVGVYSFSSKIYNILKQYINAVVVVTVPRLVYFREQDEGRYFEYLQKVFRLLLLMIFPVAVGFTIFSDSVLLIAGGVEYLPGSNSLKILMISLIFAITASVFTNCILIINRLEKYCLISTILSALSNIVLNFILIPRWGIEGAAFTTVVAEMLNLYIQSRFAKKSIKMRLRIDGRDALAICLGCLGTAAISVTARRLFAGDTVASALICIFIAFVASVLAYGILILILYRDFRPKRLGRKKEM